MLILKQVRHPSFINRKKVSIKIPIPKIIRPFRHVMNKAQLFCVKFGISVVQENSIFYHTTY